MIGTVILCSGQGAQGAGMFTLLSEARAAAPVFAAAKRVLDSTDPRDLAKQSGSDAIHTNRIGQILCCTQAMAAWAVIKDEMPRPLLVAGYSVGELSAWGVAGLLDADSVLELAEQRARAMDAATLQPSGLVAIRGLTRAVLEPLCQAHECFVAIVNAADRMLVGGTRASLAALVQDAEAAGAERTTMLPVAVASHTPLLADASTAFYTCLKEAPIGARPAPGIRLLSGIDGAAVFDVHAGKVKLALQIRQTVDWAACMDACHSQGVTKFIELGPGSALCHLVRDILPDADARSLSEFHSLDGFVQWAGKPSRG